MTRSDDGVWRDEQAEQSFEQAGYSASAPRYASDGWIRGPSRDDTDDWRRRLSQLAGVGSAMGLPFGQGR